MRARQYLVANGIAVLQVNPSASETWDWYGQSTWDEGYDKFVLSTRTDLVLLSFLFLSLCCRWLFGVLLHCEHPIAPCLQNGMRSCCSALVDVAARLLARSLAHLLAIIRIVCIVCIYRPYFKTLFRTIKNGAVSGY